MQIVGAEPDYQRRHGTKAVSSLRHIYLLYCTLVVKLHYITVFPTEVVGWLLSESKEVLDFLQG